MERPVILGVGRAVDFEATTRVFAPRFEDHLNRAFSGLGRLAVLSIGKDHRGRYLRVVKGDNPVVIGPRGGQSH